MSITEIIIKSEVWTIIHCLGLGHETMVCAVCLFIFLLNPISPTWVISRDLESTRWGFWVVWSLWNLIGVSIGVLSRRLSKLRAIRWFWYPILGLQELVISKKDYRLANRHPVLLLGTLRNVCKEFGYDEFIASFHIKWVMVDLHGQHQMRS